MGEAAMPKAGDLVGGKYQIESLIGEGGMGAVFAATHIRTNKRVALKWMLPEVARNEDAVQRLLREAQAAGRIQHPNVVDVYDIGEHEGSPFLVMELLQGESLTVALERGPMEVPELVRVLAPAMRGVAAAHREGVIHRDIKPDNIFLCRSSGGTLVGSKVLDFGISKLSASQGQLNPRLTKTGAIMGTPYYMSPEQIRGVSEVDGRVDVYAFGVILYEALTGHVPFDGKTYSALVLEIATGVPRRLTQLNPNLPLGLEQLVLKAMARELDQRHPDLEALATDLERFAIIRADENATTARLDGAKTLGSSTTPFTSVAPSLPVTRGPRYVAIAAIVLLAAGAAAAWLGSRDSQTAEVEPPVAAPSPVHAARPPAPPEPAEPTAPVAPSVPATPPTEAQLPAEPPAQVAAPVTGLPPTQPAKRPTTSRRADAPSEPLAPPLKPSRPRGTGRSGAIAADEF